MNLSLPFFNRVKFIDKLTFTKHMSTMIHAGVSLSETLETLAIQASSQQLRTIFRDLLGDVRNGVALADALRRHPEMFDEFYVNLVAVGEESGNLAENFQFLVDHLSKSYALQRKVKGALTYPGVVFGAASLMAFFVSIFILPQLVGFFDSFAIELPITTRILLAIAGFMEQHGIVFFVTAAGVVVAVVRLTKLPFIKPHWHRAVLRMPLFGQLILHSQLSGMMRNLGVLVRSGVPLSRALETTTYTVDNLYLRSHVKVIHLSLNQGITISQALERYQFSEFPPLVSTMIAVGERTGNLEEIMLYLATFYEDEIDNITKNMTTVLEPIMLLSIGLIVGFMAMAIISPIYELTGSVRGGVGGQ
ncbi:MAG: hypothetical protein COU69_03090 [Candidatus Pacebacteria bacterium CG10_big_fil_rev_8_21_14_0_10_56_10]|nr:MAG: hypothetical protein COU69_03090 [Candidatus Pacebacteria bacterium CG10_big_fil_rev_8_21_14_0_10_56_10]